MRQNCKSLSSAAAALALSVLLLAGTASSAVGADIVADQSQTLTARTDLLPGGSGMIPSGFGDPFNLAEQSSGPVSSGTSSIAGSPVEKGSRVPSVASYGKAFLPDLVDGTKRIFSPDIGTVALIGLGVTAVSFAFDRTVDDYFQNQQPIKNQANTGDKIGQGYVPFGLGVALFATGQIIDNRQLADTGAVSVEALVVTGITTEALKYITGRERPNHSDNMSFPSGHASMTAAFAASVSEMYDWNLFIAVPLFAYSAFVGASRIQANEHHFSDVVAGWTLGTVVGMSFARSRKEKNAAEADGSLSIAPLVDGHYRGVVFNWRF